jgi:hypothetical protein
MTMKRICKILLVMTAAVGLSGYARVPEGDAVATPNVRAPSVTVRAEARVAPRTAESQEPSEWTLLLCGFLVVGFIARRKSRLVAP